MNNEKIHDPISDNINNTAEQYQKLGEEVPFAGQPQSSESQTETHNAETFSPSPSQLNQTPSFDTLRAEGKLPEGVRDEQDYQEYLAEQQARLEENIHYIKEQIIGMTDANDDYLTGTITDVLYSKELATLVSEGLNVSDLYDTHLLDKDERSIITLNYFIKETYKQTKEDDNNIKPLLDIIKKLKAGEKLNQSDYKYTEYVGNKNGIMFGYPGDSKRILNTLNDYEYNFDHDGPNFLIDAMNAIHYCQPESLAEERELKNTLAEVCRKNMPDYLAWLAKEQADWENNIDPYYEIDFYDDRLHSDAKKLILGSTNFIDIVQLHDQMQAAGFSEEEMLSSVYFPKSEKFNQADPGYYIGRHIGSLERFGFNRKNIIELMHEEKVNIGLEEINDMRRDGVDDADIIYAGRFYRFYRPDATNDVRWFLSSLEGADFSESDTLKATLREIRSAKRAAN